MIYKIIDIVSIDPSIYPTVHLFIHLFIPSFIDCFVRSFIYLFTTLYLSVYRQAEIKYLMAAHRAARYDRKLMMMNQEEITRLRRSTQKIRGKVREEEVALEKVRTVRPISD